MNSNDEALSIEQKLLCLYESVYKDYRSMMSATTSGRFRYIERLAEIAMVLKRDKVPTTLMPLRFSGHICNHRMIHSLTLLLNETPSIVRLTSDYAFIRSWKNTE